MSLGPAGASQGDTFQRAKRAYELGDYRKAAMLLGQHLKVRPNDASAHYYMGHTQFGLGNYPASLSHFWQAHRLKPTQKDYATSYAGVVVFFTFSLVGQQRFEDALRVLNEASGRFPDEPEIGFARGVALFERWRLYGDPNDHLQALALWKQFSDAESLSSTADIIRGIADFEGQNYAAALAKFEAAEVRHPEHPYAPMWCGLAHAALGHYDDAEVHFTRALILFQKNASLYRYLGDVKALQGNTGEARRLYGRALELKPGDTATLINLALVYEAEGRVDEAIGTYRDVITLHPGDFDTLLQMIRLYQRAGRPDNALATLHKAREAVASGNPGPKLLEERNAVLLLETALTYLQRRDRA
ncbi:MAG: tetratricopeptide repeat protein, partial [Candidatus Eremiobacterota bacterium]